MPAWFAFPKLDALEGLFIYEDAGHSRQDYAASHHISPRTLQRWIHEFNTGGVTGVMERVPPRPGRKRKIGVMEFRNRILPVAQQALASTPGQADTMKALHEAALKLGIFPGSYATFRRRVRAGSEKYRRRRIQPTLEEQAFYLQTGRWPPRLKAYGRRWDKQMQRASERFQESVRQDAANPAQQDVYYTSLRSSSQ